VPAGGPGRVLTGVGRQPARARGSALLLARVLTTGPGLCRAVLPHAGHGKRRALDRRQNGGQVRAGPLRSLALFVLFLGSGGGGSQPVTHRAQPADLRPRLDDAIGCVEHKHHTDDATNDQAGQEYPTLA
jgi:hypothetical protein